MIPVEEAIMPDLGACVRAHRQAKELTIRELARRAGLHFTTLSNVEHNRFVPNWRTLNKIAAALGIAVSTLTRSPR